MNTIRERQIKAQLRVLEPLIKASEALVYKYPNDTMLKISCGVYKMERKELLEELNKLKQNQNECNPIHT